MTARIARLAGAILLENAGQYFLVGNTKEPCDWLQAGFHPPGEIDALKHPFLSLALRGEARIAAPYLAVDVPGVDAESLAQILANRFLIRRNGSVSERLWRMVTGESDETGAPGEQPIDARWLIEMPDRIWEIVRDAALKCL